MHSLLTRQLKRLGLSTDSLPPTQESWQQLLQKISRTYTEADQGRELLEQSLALSSKEMQQLYDNLQQTSEARIKNAQDRTRMIIDHALDGVITVDEAGVIVDWNPQAETLFGWTKEEIVGQALLEKIIPPEFREGHSRGFQRYLQTRQATMLNKRLEVSVLNRKGEVFSAELSVNPFTVDGRTIFSAFIRDITEQKEAEQSLRLAKDTAEQAAKAKSEFLATMSHEIRTPMNGIIGMTGLLLETELTPEQRQYSETVRHSGETLLTIINDILDFSKIEAGKLEFEIIDFDLRISVEETLDLLAEKAASKHLELVGLVSTDVPTALRGDPGRLRQILMNLLSNAIKFTESGEVILTIQRLEETDHDVVLQFQIVDTGIGISEAAKVRLFQPFSQADGSTTRKFGGTGLGLAISKQLVGHMQGEIGVNSMPEQGSTFWFTTRLDKHPENNQAHPPQSNLQGVRICCVDDHHPNRELLTQFVDVWGMKGAIVSTPDEALAQLRKASTEGHPFELAVLDMDMPGMDGLTLARAIKADPALASVSLVLLTSLGRRGDAAAAYEAGIIACLPKPIRKTQLEACLEAALGRCSGETSTTLSLTSSFTQHSLKEIQEHNDARILVADDHTVNQQLAVLMLQRLGHRVDVVANGLEAIDAVKRIPYALVFMDCQMPEMDGYEATRQIREWEQEEAIDEKLERRSEAKGNRPRVTGKIKEPVERNANDEIRLTPRVPIIAMTANAMRGDREACLAAGMDDYLWKPVKPEHLAQKLDKWLPKKANDEEPEMPKVEQEAPSAGISRTSPVDSEVLREWQSLGGPAFVARMVNQFIKDATACIHEVGLAVESRDPVQLSEAAHGLKGISRNMGANDLAALCERLERQMDPMPPEYVDQQFVRLDQEFQLVCKTLENEKETL